MKPKDSGILMACLALQLGFKIHPVKLDEKGHPTSCLSFHKSDLQKQIEVFRTCGGWRVAVLPTHAIQYTGKILYEDKLMNALALADKIFHQYEAFNPHSGEFSEPPKPTNTQ